MADQGSQGLLSPFLRRRRIAQALPWVEGTVLDVGCGAGALAAHVPPGRYVGMDSDAHSIAVARRCHVGHAFDVDWPSPSVRFRTIACLAVIEHSADPLALVRRMAGFLDDSIEARIVITTPYPAFDRIHQAGAAWGLFSHAASEEHETLLDASAIRSVAKRADLVVAHYGRFLLGANQLAVLKRPALGAMRVGE